MSCVSQDFAAIYCELYLQASGVDIPRCPNDSLYLCGVTALRAAIVWNRSSNHTSFSTLDINFTENVDIESVWFSRYLSTLRNHQMYSHLSLFNTHPIRASSLQGLFRILGTTQCSDLTISGFSDISPQSPSAKVEVPLFSRELEDVRITRCDLNHPLFRRLLSTIATHPITHLQLQHDSETIELQPDTPWYTFLHRFTCPALQYLVVCESVPSRLLVDLILRHPKLADIRITDSLEDIDDLDITTRSASSLHLDGSLSQVRSIVYAAHTLLSLDRLTVRADVAPSIPQLIESLHNGSYTLELFQCLSRCEIVRHLCIELPSRQLHGQFGPILNMRLPWMAPEITKLDISFEDFSDEEILVSTEHILSNFTHCT